MLTNRHVVIALIVAPILAVMAWFAVDRFLGEQPQAALPGKSYPLVAKSNCRYASGVCTLENEDFALEIRFSANTFTLSSPLRLQGVLFAVGGPEAVPKQMILDADAPEEGRWQWSLNTLAPLPTDRIYVVAKFDDVTFFGDAATVFVEKTQPDT